MSNIVSLRAFKISKQIDSEDLGYRAKILSMGMPSLLEEMVLFQEERKAAGIMNLPMMHRGLHLFRALEEHAESKELQILSRSYRRHLEYEINAAKETFGKLR